MSDLLAARSQMAMSLAFHILFAVAGMAMPLLMVLAQWRHQRTGDPSALELDDETRLDALERLHRERMGAGFEEATATGSAGGGGSVPSGGGGSVL